MTTRPQDVPAKKASKQPGKASKQRVDKSPVKLHADVMESVRIVATYRGENIQDILSNILRPIIFRMEREERAKRDRKLAEEGGE